MSSCPRHLLPALTTPLVIAILTAVPASAQPDIDTLVQALDQLYRSDDSYAVMTMDVVTPNWQRTLEMEAWSMGTDRTFIRVTSPSREAGSATLRIGDEMWNYLPNTGSTVRVPPSMMAGSWMGSDITNNDIVKEITYSEDYTYAYTADTTLTGSLQEGLVYVRLIPDASTAVVWSSIVCAVETARTVPVWERYYDREGVLIKTVTFSQVGEMGGRIVPAVMEVTPADREGHRTTITWSDARFDQGVDESIFTLSNLQSGGGG